MQELLDRFDIKDEANSDLFIVYVRSIANEWENWEGEERAHHERRRGVRESSR